MSAVSLQGVDISYGSVDVVRNLDLDIKAGEFVVFVGPSGCGKSTTLRLIAGLEEGRAGHVSIGGRVVNDVDPARRDVAMVFQNYALFPHMSVADNISFGMRLRGEAKGKIAASVADVARMVGLQDHLHKRPGALSGGQRQRVALARAIVRKPAVFLFDEPLSNLDAEFRAAMRYELSKLHRELGSTMIYVTHDQVEAMTMGDRIAVLAPLKQAGRSNLMQFGTPEEVYHRPANLFVAKFIGSPPMNFFEARAEGGSIRIGALNLPGAGHLPTALTVGIRPEHVRLGAGDGPSIAGTIEGVENLGHEKLWFIATAEGRIVARTSDSAGHGVGENVAVHLVADRLHVFDRTTGDRVEV
ncbi:ABC transporter ATP-binding protein [Shinella zoogloeoides]|uniref:ABC transporter ATP-binding protein n=1 Tax=Shinella zoogloeoides TaxID=352475 RepID=UPI00299EAF24|nr:ABC transporter ATP-binding protein [Shinella zoogloeoides]WPE23031.1 sn-glycerol-3-phosphate import ATP-binding protein UgpC [Shinella zoogloeoides]